MGEYTINKIDKATGEVTGTIGIEVRAYPISEPRGNTKGYANVSVDGQFALNGISIVEGKNGLFVSMPQTRDGKGNYRDVFHPVTAEGSETLRGAVLKEFGAALEEMVVKKESVLEKMREAAAAVKQAPTPSAEKGAKEKAAKRVEQAL